MKAKWILIVLVLVLLAWYFWPGSKNDSKAVQLDGQELVGEDLRHVLSDRIWIDTIPKNERDIFSLFVMLDDPRFGAFSTSSAFEGNWASFEWRLDKGRLFFYMQQKQKDHRVRVRIQKDRKQCYPFDMCMVMDGAPRGPKKYGSMNDWIIEGASDLSTIQPLAEHYLEGFKAK